MDPFKFINDQCVVDCYAVEVYLPADYADSAYRGTPYYSILGVKVKYLGVGNFRFFKSEKEMQNPDSVPCYPLGIPMDITSIPTEIDVRDVKFSANSRLRKCIVLTLLKGDIFMVSTELIKSSDPMMMILSRLEQGKIDHIPPEVAVSIMNDCEMMNGLSLRIPSEEMEIFVAERYRDPDHPTRQYRYHTGASTDPYDIVMNNVRTDVTQTSTFAGVFHEDINSALIVAANRANRGENNSPNSFESVIRGLNMDDLKEKDKDQFGSITEGGEA